MRISKQTIALFALPTSTIAVSLSDFTPRVSNLPAGCKSVYTEVIDGCSASDFASGGCSEECVEALQSMAAPVKTSCGNKGITGGNIIVAFLAGNGPGSLCPNAAAILGGGSSPGPDSSSAASSTKASHATTSSSSAPSRSSNSSSRTSSAALSGTTTVSSLATSATHSSSGLLVDSSSTPTAAGASSTASSDRGSSGNDHSGGGSPFDASGNMSTAPAACSISLTVSTLTAALMLLVLLR